MFGHSSYLLYTAIFTLPLIFILWIYQFSSLKRNLKTVLATTFLLTLYGFFLWPVGLIWKTWAYSSEKILGIKILGTHIEDILWWFLIVFLLSSFTVAMAEKERRKESILKRG